MHSLQQFDMDSLVDLLTMFNFHQWKGDMEIQLRAIGLYRVTMDTEEEPTHVIDKATFLNKNDEAFVFLSLYLRGYSIPALEIEYFERDLGPPFLPVWKIRLLESLSS